MSTTTQTQALAVQSQTSPLIIELADRWRINPKTMLDTLKATVFPRKDNTGSELTVTNEMMIAFLQVANEYRLNPFLKELYAFPTKGGGIVPMVPVDGWSNIVNRNPEYDGVEFKDEWVVLDPAKPHDKSLFSTTCVIYRKDRSHPTVVTEYMQECFQPTKEPWKKWPARMLRHKAFIQCARIAFSLAGIYDPDEAERIAAADEARVSQVIERPKAIVEGTVANLDSHTQSTQPAQTQGAQTETKTCACSCCKAGKCECASKEAFDRCGCQPCVFQCQPKEKQVEQAFTGGMQEEAKAEVVNPDQPTGAELFPAKNEEQKTDVEYVKDVKKLMAISRSVYGADYEAKVHQILNTKWGIDSLKRIPKAKYDEICKYVGEAIKAK